MHPIGISADRDHGKTDAVVIGFVQYLFQIVPGNKFFEFGKLILPQFNSEWTIRCRLGFRVRPHVEYSGLSIYTAEGNDIRI